MYGKWQLGHAPLSEDVKKHAEFAAAMRAKDPSIELDQWNYPHALHVCSEPGTRYFLKDALGIAAGIHEYSRQSDVSFTANYAQTVNVIGAIKTTKTAAAFDTTGLVLSLYRARFGLLPVTIAGAPDPLDAAAAWREDRSALTLAIVNPTAEPQALALQVKGAAFAPAATLRRIAGTDPLAYNEPGKPAAVKIEESTNVPVGDRLTVPPISISIYELRPR
jgi:alpha-N-arabinofuranosidase